MVGRGQASRPLIPKSRMGKWAMCVPEVSDMQPLGAKVEGPGAPQESGSQKMSPRPTLKGATCTEPGARRDLLKQTPAEQLRLCRQAGRPPRTLYATLRKLLTLLERPEDASVKHRCNLLPDYALLGRWNMLVHSDTLLRSELLSARKLEETKCHRQGVMPPEAS